MQYSNIDNSPKSPSRNQRLYIEKKKVLSIKKDGSINDVPVVNLNKRQTVGGPNSALRNTMRNASPVGRKSMQTTRNTASPIAGPRKNFGYQSPISSARSRRSGASPSPRGMDLYRGQKQYEERKAALLRQIDNSRAERNEHEI